MNTEIDIKKDQGVSLIELLIVLTIIGIVAAIGVPQYGVFISKNNAKRSTTDLLQNIRLARTMAIKENRRYIITFNEDSSNTYRTGFDGDTNGSLLDAVDEYGDGGEVRLVDLTAAYGNNIVINNSFVVTPPNGPNGIPLTYAASFTFEPDGSVGSTGTAYVQHNSSSRGYTFCVELANASGLTNLYLWQGDVNNSTDTAWTEIR